MKSLHVVKKAIAFAIVLLSLSFMFSSPSLAETYYSQAQHPIYLLGLTDSQSITSAASSSSSTSQSNENWEITSVPIFPLLPGFEWGVKTQENGKKLVITHGDEEVLTLVKKS